MVRFWAFSSFAYLFGVVVRLYWVFWATTQPQMSWGGELLINTNDGYYFGYLAKSGNGGEALSLIAAFIADISGVSIDSVMIYLSVFLAPLIVVPVMGIARILGDINGGFIAALLAVIAHSYYNRTMAGYFDTDMLNVVLILSLVWAFVRLAQSGDGDSAFKSLFLVLAAVWACLWWYRAAASLVAGVGVFWAIYLAVFRRRFWAGWAALMVIVAVWAGFGGAMKVWQSISAYIIEQESSAELHFYGVMQTIIEGKNIDLWQWGERVGGALWVAALGVFGWCVAVWRHKAFMISAPMMILGGCALFWGLRFTIYAVPVSALGFGLIISLLWQRYSGKVATGLALGVISGAILINLAHIVSYKPSSVLNSSEAEALNALNEVSGERDFTLSWWDYGYGVRYYGGLNSFIDGARHSGADNYMISWALWAEPKISANIARTELKARQNGYLGMEYWAKKLGVKEAIRAIKSGEITENSVVSGEVSGGVNSENSAPRIFYYLPARMIDIMSVIARFWRVDVSSGEPLKRPLWIVATEISRTTDSVVLGGGVVLFEDHIKINDKSFMLAGVVKTSYKDGKMVVKERQISPSGLWVVISGDRMVVMDKEAFDSAFVQLFMLQRWQNTPFKPVWLSEDVAIYELK